jgi:hypothetical protein
MCSCSGRRDSIHAPIPDVRKSNAIALDSDVSVDYITVAVYISMVLNPRLEVIDGFTAAGLVDPQVPGSQTPVCV